MNFVDENDLRDYVINERLDGWTSVDSERLRCNFHHAGGGCSGFSARVTPERTIVDGHYACVTCVKSLLRFNRLSERRSPVQVAVPAMCEKCDEDVDSTVVIMAAGDWVDNPRHQGTFYVGACYACTPKTISTSEGSWATPWCFRKDDMAFVSHERAGDVCVNCKQEMIN